MKKTLSFFLALMLCFSCVAMAESVTSKTTADMTDFEIVVNDPVIAETAVIATLPSMEAAEEAAPEVKAHVEAVQNQVTKMVETVQAGETIESFFGELKSNEGETVVLSEVLDVKEGEALNVFDVCPIVADGFPETEEFEEITVTMAFPTVYAADEKVIILVGFLQEDGSVTWEVLEGIGIATENEGGAIQVKFPAEIVKKIQAGTAMLAVVSKR